MHRWKESLFPVRWLGPWHPPHATQTTEAAIVKTPLPRKTGFFYVNINLWTYVLFYVHSLICAKSYTNMVLLMSYADFNME